MMDKPGYNNKLFVRADLINDTWDCSNRAVKYYWEKKDNEAKKPFYEVTITTVQK
ncbi:MAG: hypothetical protein IJQ93_03975 [Bacteroidales bacterium]|nr:hypothetical protein [Bacteroidales bacterium]